MKPKKPRETTILRRKKKELPSLADESMSKKVQTVVLFTQGNTYQEISEKLSWSRHSIKTEIRKVFESLKVLIATESLIASHELDSLGRSRSNQAKALHTSQKKLDASINEDFLSKLSPEDDMVLTQEEIMFCYLLVHEGDESKALEDSGLAKGLIKSNTSYKRAKKLRILMLKGKKNIIRYTSNLQVAYAKELNINKEAVQSLIVRQITQLESQNNPKLACTIAKLTEQLGRTVGAFTEKIILEEVSFDEAMDKMLEMRKVKGINESVELKPSETFVYDPEKIG